MREPLAEQWPDAQLESTLRQVLNTAVQVRRRPYPYATSHRLDAIRVTTSGGTRHELLFKDLSWDRLLPEAGQSKPAFLYEPRREIEAYRRLLSGRELGTAQLYGVVEGGGGRVGLILEKVLGVELWQVGELDAWCDVARWLGRLHSMDLLAETDELPLLTIGPASYRFWLDRARLAVGDRLAPVAACTDHAVRVLAHLPATFIHGELYPSNVIVAPGRVCPIDWEMASVGPGLMDLAALTSGWADDGAWHITEAYVRASAVPWAEEELRVGLDVCRLHQALQWLGWSSVWQPPPEHARDWLAVAVNAAERLGE